MLSWDEFNQEEAPAAAVNSPKIEQPAVRLDATSAPVDPVAQAAGYRSGLDVADEQNNTDALQRAITELESLDTTAGIEELEGSELLLNFLGGSKLLLAGLLFSLLLFNLGSELLTQMLAKPVYHTGHHFDGLAQLLERDQRPFRIVVQLVLVTHTAIVPIVVINFLLLVCRPGSIPGSIPGQRTARLILNNSGLEKVLFFA